MSLFPEMSPASKVLLCIALLCPFLAYHLLGYWTELLVMMEEYQQAERFASIPDIDTYRFLHPYTVLRDARDVLRRGILFPAVLRYLESMVAFRLARENPATTIFLFMVSLFMFLWFLFGYLNKKHAIEIMSKPMLEKAEELRRMKREMMLARVQMEKRRDETTMTPDSTVEFIKPIPTAMAAYPSSTRVFEEMD